LREKHQDLSIGYFWHIPFPSSPVFRVLPWCREILSGLLGCDLIGFQLRLHAENFLDAVEQVFDFPVDRERFLVKVGKRNVKVGHFPVGIDFSKWEEIGVSSTNLERVGEIRKELGAEKIILGVDRLDYTKGIKERLLAYEHFLEKYPDYHGRVCMFQIAVPSRTRVEEYRILRREIDEAVGRISGRFSSRGWAPVRYLYKTLPVEELVNYYSAADVAMVTPLRDGMNLVAEEYVACRTREDGCLILSEFAGASEILSDAIVVNPYNIDEISESLHNALSMGEAAKRLRMQQLRKAARENDVYRWCQSFMVSLIKTEKTVSSR
jgi:trehalose-6-phosphate synthase